MTPSKETPASENLPGEITPEKSHSRPRKTQTRETSSRKVLAKKAYSENKKIITEDISKCDAIRHNVKSPPKEKVFACKICNRIFTRLHRLQSHVRTHRQLKNEPSVILKNPEPEKPALQENIPAQLAESGSQEVEMVEEAPLEVVMAYCDSPTDQDLRNGFSCDVCCRFFKSKCYLERHYRIHTKEKPHKCEICGKGFAQKGNLTVHTATHTGVKNHQCYICGQMFSFIGTLKTHLITHSNVMPYVCNVCSKGFTSLCFLKRHYQIHTGSKPYVCTICGRGFAQVGNLNVHYQTHNTEKNFTCEQCGRAFTRQLYLKQHSKVHHKDLKAPLAIGERNAGTNNGTIEDAVSEMNVKVKTEFIEPVNNEMEVNDPSVTRQPIPFKPNRAPTPKQMFYKFFLQK